MSGSTSIDPPRLERLIRNVVVSATLAALAYLVFSLWAGWQDVASAVRRVGAAGLAAALALSALNYALRFVRWQMYLRNLGQHIPNVPSAIIYLSGFAFTTTPGKAGELLRGLFLHRRGTPYLQSTAAFVSERLSDLLAMAALCLPGLLALAPLFGGLAGAGLVVGAALLWLLGRPSIAGWAERWLARRDGRIESLARQALTLIAETRRCHTRHTLLVSTALSLFAWGAEALAFALVLDRLGIAVPLQTAVFIYAASMIAGALSFLPGGLGGAEATMVGLLALSGANGADSIAATILIRFTTLWFAVGLGLLLSVAARRVLLATPVNAGA